ncbi:MAG: glycerophosphoryl diester phosphodiesterase [Frankiales bacterium]|nr:glycerophosphoryl diester phosphodiesterase [Frankiales bacterium]
MLILGHRGAAHPQAPENSLAAVELALLAGADGVEVDVRLTADGVPVCHHDASLRRTAGDPRFVSTLRYDELATIGLHRIPLLSEVIDLVEGRGRLIIDVKTAAAAAWPAGECMDAVAAVLRRQRPSLVTVSSFDRPRILQLRQTGVLVRTALLGRPGLPLGVLLRRALRDGHEEAHPYVSDLLAGLDLVEPARRRGLCVTGWTVNEVQDLRRLAGARVAGVITDDPVSARLALRPALVPA